jgi:hypothetical protein
MGRRNAELEPVLLRKQKPKSLREEFQGRFPLRVAGQLWLQAEAISRSNAVWLPVEWRCL